MAIKIALANRKGGIGKSTTALALSAGLKLRGYRVLLIDMDSQRNSSTAVGAQTNNVATMYDLLFSGYKASDCIQTTAYCDVIPADELLQYADRSIKTGPGMYKHLKKALVEIEDLYDYIIFDNSPAAGVLLGNTLMCTDYVIIPFSFDSFGIQGLVDFYSIIQEYQEDNPLLSVLGLLPIKYKSGQNLTRDLEENILPEYAKQMHTKVFKTKIRESVRCQEAQTLRVSLFEYAPHSNPAIDYNNLIDEILEEIGNGSIGK